MVNKLMKRFLRSLVIKEMQIKTTVRYRFTPTRVARIRKIANVDGDVEKLEPSYTASGDVKWCSHFGKQSGSS